MHRLTMNGLAIATSLALAASCDDGASDDGGDTGTDADTDTDSDTGGDVDIDSDSDCDCDDDQLEAEDCGDGDWDGGCLEGDVTIASAVDVEALAGVGCITGTLRVTSSDLVDLALPELARVCNLRVCDNPALETLELGALQAVGDELRVFGNPALESVDVGAVTEVGGGIEIGDEHGSECPEQGNPSLTGISGFEGLTEVGSGEDGGWLKVVDCTALSDLDAFSGVQSVAGLVLISGNSSLASLAGLSQLGHIGDGSSSAGLSISDNDALASLDGIGAIGGAWNISVDGNAALASISALGAVTDKYSVLIRDNPSLASLAGLEGLDMLPTIIIENNDALVDLAGLAGTTEAEMLAIVGNESLVSLNGLESMDQIWDYGLIVRENTALESIDALGNLWRIQTQMSIVDNPALPTCAVTELLEALDQAPSGETCLWGNLDDGCDDVTLPSAEDCGAE